MRGEHGSVTEFSTTDFHRFSPIAEASAGRKNENRMIIPGFSFCPTGSSSQVHASRATLALSLVYLSKTVILAPDQSVESV